MFVVMPLPTTTSLAADVNPQFAGSPVTFTATVVPVTQPGAPTGVVSFFDGTTLLAQVPLGGNGLAVFATSALAVGAHAINAIYSGDVNFASSTGMLTQTINAALPTLTLLNISPANSSIYVGSTQQYVATGQFSDNSVQDLTGTAAWTSSNSGAATINASGLATGVAVGTVTITARFSGVSSSIATLGVSPLGPPAPAPTFSPGSGTYSTTSTPVQVTITDSTSGAKIYYTKDGTLPTTSSSSCMSPCGVQISITTTLRAMAVATGASQGSTTVATYTIAAVSPTFSPGSGTFCSPTSVTILDATPGATIYYTTDGSFPTTSSMSCNSPCVVPSKVSTTTTIRAMAAGTGISQSGTVVATYTIAAQNPTFSPAAGTYTTPTTVTINEATPGVTIYYTLNGGFPTTSSANCTSPCTILPAFTANTTIRAMALGPGISQSGTSVAAYSLAALNPTFTPGSGTYTGAQQVQISDTSTLPGVVIYYTTNGSIPTTSLAPCANPCTVTVAATSTIKAIASGPNLSQSGVVMASYTIH